MRVRFRGDAAEGATIAISIDEALFHVGVFERRAVLIAEPYSGKHSVTLADPDYGQSTSEICGR